MEPIAMRRIQILGAAVYFVLVALGLVLFLMGHVSAGYYALFFFSLVGLYSYFLAWCSRARAEYAAFAPLHLFNAVVCTTFVSALLLLDWIVG